MPPGIFAYDTWVNISAGIIIYNQQKARPNYRELYADNSNFGTRVEDFLPCSWKYAVFTENTLSLLNS